MLETSENPEPTEDFGETAETISVTRKE